MGKLATDDRQGRAGPSEIERLLREELARADRSLSGVAPVLSHMLASPGQVLVSEAVVARLRGMLGSLATQLLSAKVADYASRAEDADIDFLSNRLASDSVVLSYCYALAMEGQLSDRLEQKASLDPVLSPLLQELIASEDAAVGELSMSVLAAQSRFIQSQRRMELPLAELPAELFHTVLKRWEAIESGQVHVSHKRAIKALKSTYDEGASRIGLLARLVSVMRGGAIGALELEHAGLALFVSALSALSNQPRELAILACHQTQASRLALGLRAAGLEPSAIERQFFLLEPAERIPESIREVAPERAQQIIRNSDIRAGR